MRFTWITKTNQWLKHHPWDTALMLSLGLIGLVTGWWASVIILDDALITYRVAENLASGRGFVYNLGERVQVTTTPLYALVLAGGTWLFGSAIRAELALNIGLAALIPILAYDLGRRLSGRITGLAGALLLTLSPMLVMAFSMESYLYVFLILVSIEAYTITRLPLAGALAGITALVRGDGVLLGISVLIYDFLAQRRLRWRLIIPAIGIPAIWYLFAFIYYGSPFPATLGAKMAQGEFNWLGVRFLDGLLAHWHRWTHEPGNEILYLIPVLMILGLIPVIRSERRWLIMIGRDVLYVTAFVGLGVPTAEWYYAPLMPGVALLTARGIQFAAENLTRLGYKSSGRQPSASGGYYLAQYIIAAILTTTLFIAVYPITLGLVQQNPDWKAKVYPDAARWIADNTSASASLATIDIGHLGYWSGRHIIDIVGLAQPDVAAQIARGDFGYAIRHYQPDMVLIGYSWIPEVQTTDWFQASYIPRHIFKFKTLDEPLLLFTRREGVKVQPDPIPATAIRPMNVDFNRQITLTGYHLNQALTPGSSLLLTLFWQVTAPLEVDFTVFVQLVDANNNIVAQKDSRPQFGFYGTPSWQPGEQVIDLHPVSLPDTIPPGHYDLLVGFYESDTGLRLQILDKAGVFQSDHIRLEDIEIQAP
ncbi:MAG: glycosyltransferase family 39 protein [Anaerolineae bacterium]|nr:glycosyltransferase family 39 protein [Anaerolineae bacterium]